MVYKEISLEYNKQTCHYMVNHSPNFLYLQTGANMQSVNPICASVKQGIGKNAVFSFHTCGDTDITRLGDLFCDKIELIK